MADQSIIDSLLNGAPPSAPSVDPAVVQHLLQPFSATPPAYANPQFLSPAQLDWRRRMAAQLQQPMQVHRPMEGVANLFRSAIGGNEEYQADMAAQGAQSAYLGALGRVAAVGRGDTGNDPTTPSDPPSAGASLSANAPQGGGGTNEAAPASVGPANALPYASASDSGSAPLQNDVADYVTSAAKARGIDPNVPLKVFGGESKLDPNASGDPNAAGQNSSFGVAQLHYGNPNGGSNSSPGLGDEFTKATGLDARDPSTWKQQVDFALDKAAQGGWGPWHAAQKLGVGDMEGIGQAPQQNAALAINTAAPQNGAGGALPPGAMAFSGSQPTGQASLVGSNPPAQAPAGGMLGTPPPGYQPPGSMPPDQRAALAHALIHGTQPSGASPQDLAIALGSPWGTAEGRAVASHMITPSIVSDSVGNQYAYRNGQSPAPLLPGSRVQMVQVGNQNVPIAISGDPRNPTVRLLSPNDGSAPNASQNPSPMPSGSAPPADRPTRVGPMAGYGPIIEQGQGIAAQGAAAEHAGAASGDQYAKDRAVAGDYATSTYPLQQAAQALDALGPTGSGPGTEGLNRVKSILQSAGFPGFDASKIQNYDDARQFIAGYVGQHGGTSKLVGAFSGDPTTNVSNAAASDLVKSALALQRMQQAKVLAFRQSGLPESKYSDFAGDFASRSDPRAYGIDQMSDAAKQKLYASMPAGSPERARFAASVRNALQTGILTQPTQSKN